MEFTGIDHQAIAAADITKLTNWYCDILGFKIHFKSDKPIILLRGADSFLLEIMPADNGAAGPLRKMSARGYSHLCLKVANINEAMAYLERNGIQWAGDIAAATGGGMVRSFYDIEGNLLQIVER